MENTRPGHVSRYTQPLSVERTEHGATIVFRCRGAFSILNDLRLREFEREVAAVEAARVILDFRDVTYVDSRGLGTLAGCVKKVGEQGKKLMLVPNPSVCDLLFTTGLDKVLQLCDSVDDAMH